MLCYFRTEKNIMNEAINLKIDESIINRVRECKFLGTIIDVNLTWKPHINLITSKISKILESCLKWDNF